MAGISKAEREKRAADAAAVGGEGADADTAAAEQEQGAADAAAAEVVATVRMTRDPEAYPAPHAADVHPDEVANFAAGGWVISA